MSAIFYGRRLLNEPEIQKTLSRGIEYPHDVTLRYSNADGFFSELWANGDEFRGSTIKLLRYEPGEVESSDVLTYELAGIITDFNILPDIAEFTVSVHDPDPLQTELPQKIYSIGDWPQTPPTVINPTPDLGRPYPLVFGHAKKIPLLYVHADYTQDFYDYIVCRTGPYRTESNNANKATTVVVYRNKIVVPPSEYTVYDGSQSSPYNGYAFIRFTREQRDFSGNLYELSADFRGLRLGADTAATRNFAAIIRCLLSDATLGLNLPIDAASFTTAISHVQNLYCDGYISERQRAQDIISELLDLCRGALTTNENGERVLTIDVWNPVVQATFGLNDGYYNNIVSVISNRNTPTRETTKSVTLNYRYNSWGNTCTHTTTYVIFPFGEDITIDTRWVRNHETADRIICYKKNLQQYGDHLLNIEVGMEARFLRRFDPVKIIIPALKINGTYQVRGLTRGINKFNLNLISYSPAIYDYTAQSLPSDENPDDETDYSNTPPAAPTNLTRVSQGTYQSTDGTTYAFAELSATPPVINFARILFGYRRQGETIPFTWITGARATAALWNSRLAALVPGITYQFACVSENSFGLKSTIVTLNHQTAPGDTIAPATPTGLTGSGKYKTWEWKWTPNTEPDLRGYQYQIATTSGFTTIVKHGFVDVNSVNLTDDTRGYGTLWGRVMAQDFTGNQSGWTSGVSATTERTKTGDIDDNQITNAKINDLSADKINAGVLRIIDGSVCNSSYGGDQYASRTGLSHFYTTAGTEIARIGYTTEGSNYWVAQFLGSNASLYGGVLARGMTVGLAGVGFGTSGSVNGVYGFSRSSYIDGYYGAAGVSGAGQAYGGYFDGGVAPVCLSVSNSASAPTHTASRGALWVTSAGILYINTSGSTTWQKVGAQ